jgi:enoyl-CoA hydratase/carnithine racemase
MYLYIIHIHLGGAVDLITACDLRYCTDSSVFCIKETDLAMVADVGKYVYIVYVGMMMYMYMGKGLYGQFRNIYVHICIQIL